VTYTKGQSVEFRIPKTIKLVKLKKRYCEEYNIHLDGANTSARSGVQFKFGNRTIEDNDTVRNGTVYCTVYCEACGVRVCAVATAICAQR
jgi:hypothetical protein